MSNGTGTPPPLYVPSEDGVGSINSNPAAKGRLQGRRVVISSRTLSVAEDKNLAAQDKAQQRKAAKKPRKSA